MTIGKLGGWDSRFGYYKGSPVGLVIDSENQRSI